MQAIDKKQLSHDEYFAFEQQEQVRYEYIAGEVFAMTGGTFKHGKISVNCTTCLSMALRGTPCSILNSDMKLFISEHDKYCYPDAVLLCNGKENNLSIEEPELIIEVLSESTESYDRGLKFEHYRSIKNLQYYLLINQERPHVELYTRQDDKHWILSEYTDLEEFIELEQWQIKLPLHEIYYNIDFNQE